MRMLMVVLIWIFATAMHCNASEPRNAALDYWRSFALIMGHPELEAWTSRLADVSKPEWTMAPELHDEFRQTFGDAMREFERASRREFCDFQPAYEEDGESALLPHMSPMRLVSMCMLADARLLIAERQCDKAAERIATVFRAAKHQSSEAFPVSSLVSLAIFTMAADTCELILKPSCKLSDPAINTLASVLESFNNDDPVGIRNAYFAHPELIIPALRSQLLAEQDPESAISHILMATPNPTQEIVDVWIAGYRQWAADVRDAWDRDDWEVRRIEIDEKLNEGGYGELTSIIATATKKPHEFYVQVRERLARLKEASPLPKVDDSGGKLPERP